MEFTHDTTTNGARPHGLRGSRIVAMARVATVLGYRYCNVDAPASAVSLHPVCERSYHTPRADVQSVAAARHS
jgi:hypothetical protein